MGIVPRCVIVAAICFVAVIGLFFLYALVGALLDAIFPWFNISHPIESISKRLTKIKKDLDWLFEPYDPNEKCGIDALAENIDETIDNAKKLKAGIDDSLKKLSNHDNNLPRPELPNPIECIQNVKLPNPGKALPDIELPKLPNPFKKD